MRPRRSNVDEPLTELIGRDEALEALEVAFQRDATRWVTLRGAPGIGKTRVALQHAATQPLAAHPGGIWICDLTRARARADVMRIVARTIGLPARSTAPQLARALSRRGATLLVLDGAQHVASRLGPLVDGWLRAAPSLRVLVTSPVRTGAAGEATLVLEPLAEADAIALFRARARDARGRELPAAADDAIAGIVRALDASPLALELAAAHTVALSPRQLLGRLDDVLDVLVSPGPGAPPAVREAGRTLAASLRLASAPARALLDACSLFAGELRAELVEALHAGPPGEHLVALGELCDRSLLRAREGEGGTALVMPALLRHHARRAFARRRDAAAIEARWAHAILSAAERATADLESHGAVDALVGSRRDLETIAARALARDDPERAARAVLVLAEVAALRGPVDAMEPLLEPVIAHEARLGPDMRARLRHARARIARRAGRPTRALEDYRVALETAESLGRDDRVARIAVDWASLLRHLARRDEARVLYERALAIHTAAGDPAGRGRALSALASMTHEHGDLEQARALFADAVATLSGTTDRVALAVARQNLGLVEQESGDLDGAERTFRRALEEHRRLGHRRFEAICELDLGCLELERGRPRDALVGLHRAHEIARGAGDRREHGLAAALVGTCCALLGRIEAADAALAEARRELRAIEEPGLLDALDLHEGARDLALAHRARLRGDDAERTRRIASVDARLARGARARGGGDELRFALRILRTQRARWEDRARSVVVAPDAAWMIVAGAARVGLEQRPLLRALMRALLDQHLARPGTALPVERLVRAGWPDERTIAPVHRNRLHVAIATLRELGLRAHLRGGRDGYHLELVEVHEPALLGE